MSSYLKQTELCVRWLVKREIVLDVVHHSGDNGAIHVVDKVDVEQYEDGGSVSLVQVREPETINTLIITIEK
jgi:hypothetical protein